MPNQKATTLTPSKAMLLIALDNYQVLGYDINIPVVQKITYFLQRFGESFSLKFENGNYGPHTDSLGDILKYLDGHYLKFNGKMTAPDTVIQLNRLDEVKSYCLERLSTDQMNRLTHLRNLIDGFESPYGLELLATVDFINQKNQIADTDEIIQVIGSWTKRKRELMKPFHIKVAHQTLQDFYKRDLL